jgi:hypothetical protein
VVVVHGTVRWLKTTWSTKCSVKPNRNEREWRIVERDARGHLASRLRGFAVAVLYGLRQVGDQRLQHVPGWFLAGHRRPPKGSPRGRPKGAKNPSMRPRRTVQ